MIYDFLVHHRFLTAHDRVPEKIAVIDNNESLTYRELASRSGYLGEKMRDDGIGAGDRVAFLLDHSNDQATSILAISSCGSVFIPINWALFPEQVEFILNDAGCRALITTNKHFEKIKENLSRCKSVKHIYLMDELSGESPLERYAPVIENDLAALLYTSGSTGTPKGVMLSHKNLLAGASIVSSYLDLTSEDKLLGVLQLSFDYGLNQLLTMLYLGGTYRFLTYLVPDHIVQVLAEEDITGLAGVPQTWMFLSRSSLKKTPLPKLRYITNSGGSVPTKVLEFLKSALPSTNIVLMYGLTEAFRSTYLEPSELDSHLGSMGKAIPNTDIMVLSTDGTRCGPGEVGELVHRGPTVAMGYWNRPEETARVYRTISFECGDISREERVVFSGDLVKTDEQGYLYFVARKDAMIKSMGIRVSPSEIEEIVFRSGNVVQAAAVGASDPVAGQAVVVFCVPSDDGSDPAVFEEDIIDFCTQHMPNYMIPRRVIITKDIPKTPNGKTNYPSLQATAQRMWDENEAD